jgi:hypothetical protein
MKKLKKNRDKVQRELVLKEDPGLSLIGLGNSGKGNLSNSHDKYLAGYTKKGKR